MTLQIDNCSETVEQLVQRHGVLHILTALELICLEQAGITRNSAKDNRRAIAGSWMADARIVAGAVRKCRN